MHNYIPQKKILVVEDCIVQQKLYSEFLNKSNCFYEVVSSGVEAIKKVAEGKNSFDLIFMDLHMPKMSGFDTFKKIKEMNCNAKIIAISADSTDDSKEKSKYLGFSDFLEKPFFRKQLLEYLA